MKFNVSEKTFRFIIICIVSSLFLIPVNIYSQKVKVLFIGSSLTAFNNLTGMFTELAVNAQKDVLVVNNARGGHNLYDHLCNPSTQDVINQQDWDYVILENGDYELMYEPSRLEVWQTIDAFVEMIKNNCSETKIIFFMDWAMKNGLTFYGTYYSYETFQQMIYDATMQTAREKNLEVAPIGSAWHKIVNEKPSMELYSSDNGHPSLPGSYLGACIYYSVIFRKSTVGNNYYNTIAKEDAQYIQSVASSTVLENLDLWNIVTQLENREAICPEFKLYQNYPNPFNPATNIVFELKEENRIRLVIYNMLGEKVKTLWNNRLLQSGTYCIKWNGENDYNRLAAPGMYIYALEAGEYREAKSMILLK